MVDCHATRRDDGRQRRGTVIDPIADVMQPFAPSVEVLGNRRISACGPGELNVRIGHLQERLFHTVALDDLTMMDGGPEGSGVVGDRGLKIVDGDGDMIDLGKQQQNLPVMRTD